MNGEQAFDAAAGIGRLIAGHYAEQRQAKKDRRNARRRATYRANGGKARSGPVTAVDDALEPEVECRCHLVAMPPCGFCSVAAETEGATS